MNTTITRATLTQRICAAAALAFVSSQALSDEWMVNCLLVNKVTAAGEIGRLTNKQVERGLCLISKEAVLAIGASDSFKREACIQASANMIREFNRRFPGRDGKEVLGTC